MKKIGFDTKINSVFAPGKDFRLNATVGLNGGPYSNGAFALGFLESTEVLLQSLMEKHWAMDVLVYPTLFNFRHGLELAFKHLTKVLGEYFDEESTFKYDHKLENNWQSINTRLKKLGVEVLELSTVDEVVKCFIEIDPTGEAFRFPNFRDGKYILQDWSIINIRLLCEKLLPAKENLISWIDASNDMLSVKKQAEAEMRDYYL